MLSEDLSFMLHDCIIKECIMMYMYVHVYSHIEYISKIAYQVCHDNFITLPRNFHYKIAFQV